MSQEPISNEPAIVDDPMEVRRAKREALYAAGKRPYGYRFDYTHHVDQLEELYKDLPDGEFTEDEVKVAGRVMAIRNQGKIAFLVLRDQTGDIQLFCRINNLGEAAFDEVKDLDVGDWVGATGVVMRSRRGQLSVAPSKVELLSKSLRPLPEKFHGLTDKEARYRQRYVDMTMNPAVRETMRKRSQIISAIRRYMDGLGFYEVETPILHNIMGGANARPFITHHNALDHDFYLRIATELPLKRLLVGGFERVYEIGRIFRNEGMDPYHNPEFTTIEAYQAFTDLTGMMDLTQGLIQDAAMYACGTLQVTYQDVDVDLSGNWPRRTMCDLASEYSGEEISFNRTREELVSILERGGGHAEDAWGKGKLIGEIFEAYAEEHLIQPTFVIDHPLEISPLAFKKIDDPDFTERFELFICGHEYANAFTELNDPVDQRERFAAQMAAKATGDDEAMGYDEDYIRALEYGMPPAGGVGLGIDRLVMLLTDSATIRDVLLFPTMKPETGVSAAGEGSSAAVASSAATAVVPAGAPVAPAAEASCAQDASPIDFSNVVVEPLFEDTVDFETFSRSDFRAEKVLACEAVPKSKKLLKFTLDDGSGTERVILSGIHAYYEPEELVGKTCIAITNLPPRKMMGIDSCGMLISAVHQEGDAEALHLLMVDGAIPAGAKLY